MHLRIALLKLRLEEAGELIQRVEVGEIVLGEGVARTMSREPVSRRARGRVRTVPVALGRGGSALFA